MANNRLTIVGLAELREALRRLPEQLRDEASQIVTKRANHAKSEITAAYPFQSLKNGMGVEVDANRFGVRAAVTNKAKIAISYEYGTQVRHTKDGDNRGKMPPANVFKPVIERQRNEMEDDLIVLLRREGLVVTGGR